MNGRGVKIGNEYARALGRLYAETPKAVFAALAFSYANRFDETSEPEQIISCLVKEWATLNENGIIQQKPPQIGAGQKGGK